MQKINQQTKIYMHSVMLRVKPEDAEVYGVNYLATTALADGEADRLQALAQSYGGSVEIETSEVDLIDVEAPMMVIGHDIESRMRTALGIIEGAVPDVTDARLNEIERAVRNSQRAQLQTLAALENIMARLATLGGEPAPARADVSPRMERQKLGAVVVHDPEVLPEPPQLTPNQQAAMAKKFPLIGTPTDLTGDPTLPMNPNARAAGKTPEMASGMMSLAGRPPTSTVFGYSGKVDDDGKPIFDKHELPRVGDSLKSLEDQSDIKVRQ
jgi:hypothetical protein